MFDGAIGFGGLAAKHANCAKRGIGISPAKAPRRKGDGLLPVMPSECEGSKKISPFGRNDKTPNLAPLREILFSHMTEVDVDSHGFDDRLPIRIQARARFIRGELCKPFVSRLALTAAR